MHENIKKKAGHWESFDDTDGLPHYCRCLLEDSVGRLWIGTRRGGVCRYDGKRFVTFTEADGLRITMPGACARTARGCSGLERAAA